MLRASSLAPMIAGQENHRHGPHHGVPILPDCGGEQIKKWKQQSHMGSVSLRECKGPCRAVRRHGKVAPRARARPRAPQFTHSRTNCMMHPPADCPNENPGTGPNKPSAPSQSMLTLQPCSGPTTGLESASYLFDRVEAARFLGVSRKTMLRFALERRLPVHRLCRKLLFKKADLERFAEAHVVPARRRRPYERS